MTYRAILVLGLGASGCFVPTEGVPRVLIESKVLDGGTQCQKGGKVVQVGLDADGDGLLDPTEVTSHVLMCDPIPEAVLPASIPDPAVVIQSGRISANYVIEKDWNLVDATDAGFDRYFEKAIVFPSPFRQAPSVIIGLTEVDTGPTNTRVRVSAENVTAAQFTLRVGTWAPDSSLWGVTIDWLAYTR